MKKEKPSKTDINALINKYCITNSIGERIKILRLYNNFDQKRWADLLGISQSFLSDVENNKTTISVEPIINIVRHLKNINSNWVLTGEGDVFIDKDTPNKYYDRFNIGEKISAGAISNFFSYLYYNHKMEWFNNLETGEAKANIIIYYGVKYNDYLNDFGDTINDNYFTKLGTIIKKCNTHLEAIISGNLETLLSDKYD